MKYQHTQKLYRKYRVWLCSAQLVFYFDSLITFLCYIHCSTSTIKVTIKNKQGLVHRYTKQNTFKKYKIKLFFYIKQAFTKSTFAKHFILILMCLKLQWNCLAENGYKQISQIITMPVEMPNQNASHWLITKCS